MDKILVTGGSGLVGSFLKKILPEAIYISSKDCDITQINQLNNLFEIHKPQTVVHLAAKVGGIQDNILKPAEYFDDNILMNTNLLKVSHRNKVKKFIGILSTCVYPDKLDHYPMTENKLFSGPPPITNFSYAYSKRCLAVQIEAYNKQYNTNYNYLIPCNLYGEYDDFKNDNKMHFITALLKKIKNTKNKKLELIGTGKPLRQFMYAGDLAKIIKMVINKNINASFNVAPNYNYSINDMAKIALKIADKNYRIVYSNPELDGQFRKDVCNSKLMKIFPDFKFTDFQIGLKKVYDKIS